MYRPRTKSIFKCLSLSKSTLYVTYYSVLRLDFVQRTIVKFATSTISDLMSAWWIHCKVPWWTSVFPCRSSYPAALRPWTRSVGSWSPLVPLRPLSPESPSRRTETSRNWNGLRTWPTDKTDKVNQKSSNDHFGL